MGSVKWATEMWEGGSLRDDLVFHPTYAASKAALTGIMVHLAREMRVSITTGFVRRVVVN
jgi:NAD(P)-dependent dehydrogenase (short-subunit alcohol dehydrogenase family)